VRILVTGGAGFIGRHLVAELRRMGHSVVALDLREGSDADEHVVGDVRDAELVRRVARVDAIFHLAAVTTPPEFEDPLSPGYEVNVMGTYNVLAAAAANGVTRVVLASSSSVYGDAPGEVGCGRGYANLYPATKLVNEVTARTFLSYGVEAVILRYFNVYGPGEETKGPASSVVWKFTVDALAGRSPVIYGDGSQSRDFIYVKDAVRATILAMERGRPGEAYDVGTGVSMPFNEVFRIVREETGFGGEALHVPNPLRSYQRFTRADPSRAREDLGFEPRYDLRAGVRELVRALRAGGPRA
jgi:UDP-glucose 4-epimerase